MNTSFKQGGANLQKNHKQHAVPAAPKSLADPQHPHHPDDGGGVGGDLPDVQNTDDARQELAHAILLSHGEEEITVPGRPPQAQLPVFR